MINLLNFGKLTKSKRFFNRDFIKSFLHGLKLVWDVFFSTFIVFFRFVKRFPAYILKLPHYARLLKRTIQKFIKDDCIGYSAQLAFNLVLSLFPIILLMVASLSFVQSKSTITGLSALIGEVLPNDIESPISTAIESAAKNTDKMKRKGDFGAIAFSLITSFVSATTCFLTIMKAMQRIYNVNSKLTFFQKYKIAFELIIIVGIAFFLILNLLVASQKIENFLFKIFKWHAIKLVFNMLKYPITILTIILSTTLIYKLSLRIGQKLEYILPGAITVAVLWVPLTLWFGDYMQNQLYGNVYKTLGKLIVIPLWMYLNSVIFFIGAELNSILYKPSGKIKSVPFYIKLSRFVHNLTHK